MSVETMMERIKKEARPCAQCGCTDFELKKIQIPPNVTFLPHPPPDNEMYFLWCKNCPHKRIEIDYDQVEENRKSKESKENGKNEENKKNKEAGD